MCTAVWKTYRDKEQRQDPFRGNSQSETVFVRSDIVAATPTMISSTVSIPDNSTLDGNVAVLAPATRGSGANGSPENTPHGDIVEPAQEESAVICPVTNAGSRWLVASCGSASKPPSRKGRPVSAIHSLFTIEVNSVTTGERSLQKGT